MKLRIRCVPVAGLVLAGLLAGCGSTNRLSEVDFTDRTVAARAAVPPPSILMVGSDVIVADRDNPIRTAATVGAVLARERALRRAADRLDSAAAQIDVPGRLARETLLRSARVLGFRPTADLHGADFVLDLRLERYGLQAATWEGAVRFILEGEMVLMDNRSRRVIWRKPIREVEPVTPALIGFGPLAGNVFTAAALAGLSTAEMVRALERLTDHAAHRLAAALRDDYERAD
ncbi:MAG: hypothetical protein D6746_15130 [Bacteroidetes bacterium]|nr:MAG: hypothetical protein D6746_15130 [Bacteroidota bacterium]GIV58725.1 MAG: hypothetical protein KatS3mg042_1638 [Rhodothermaceae bacterium]